MSETQDRKPPKHRVIPASFVFVLNDLREVLLHRRFETGFRDGQYDVPSGHPEPGEMRDDGTFKGEMLNVTAARETLEEVGLEVDPKSLELFHVITNEAESPGKPYLYLCFRVGLTACKGKPRIMEPKCDDLGWFSLDNIPPNTVPHVKQAIPHIGTTVVTFSNLADHS